MLSIITIDHLEFPNWSAVINQSYQTTNITVWRAEIRQLTSVLERLEAVLDFDEKAKAMRFHQEADKQRFVISKAVLRILLSRYLTVDPKEIRFKSGKNKKPGLENNFGRELEFNISHSGNWVLIAISDKEIGVDIEKINASFTYKNLLPLSLNKTEAEFIENSDSPYQSFYQLWTRKESLLKATGKGLVDELASVPSLIGIHQNSTKIIGPTENWQVLSFPVDENHTGSVAFIPVKTALRFFNFQL